jgi:AraC-like DNA-binding protein
MSAPLVQTKLGDNDTLYYFIPHEFVSQRMVWREEACAKPAHAEQGLWRLVRDALTGLARDEAHLTDAEFVGAARIVGDLVLLASDNLVDLQTTHSSVRAANLARAKRFIRAHCTNPNLTLTDVALACRLSLRYLHNLFRDDGRTMREVLQGERLRRAYDLLERQDPRSTTVTSIALASGFSNSSHFATAFRRAYSIMPKELLHRR